MSVKKQQKNQTRLGMFLYVYKRLIHDYFIKFE